jgi:predicted DNA-binding ribbon-helix-helix protein
MPSRIRLEPEFWEALDDICARESTDCKKLIRKVHRAAPKALRACSLRVFILQYYRNRERAAAHRQGLHLIKIPTNEQ